MISTTTCDYTFGYGGIAIGRVCTTTPASQFTQGEVIISFFLFILFLALFTIFMINIFTGAKI